MHQIPLCIFDISNIASTFYPNFHTNIIFIIFNILKNIFFQKFSQFMHVFFKSQNANIV